MIPFRFALDAITKLIERNKTGRKICPSEAFHFHTYKSSYNKLINQVETF